MITPSSIPYYPLPNLNHVIPKTKLRLEQVSLFTQLKTQLALNQQGYPILQDISFEVCQGDRLSIVGPSGAGKTALLRLINRLGEPSSGKIYLENQEYHQIPVLQLRQDVVLLLPESRLLGMTVAQALAYPLVLRRLPKQTIEQRVNYWMEQLEIPRDWLGRTEAQFSTGERQIIAIARALVTQPNILLLDEPISTLDIGRASRLMEVFHQLADTHHTTIVMVNHQLELAQMFSTRLVHLQQGRLLKNQKASEVNWVNLRDELMQAQKQADEEWI